MMIPQKAIISCPTKGSSEELFAFLGSEGYRYGGTRADIVRNQWDIYKDDTCYSLHSDRVICRTSRESYKGYCEEHDDDLRRHRDYCRHQQFVPDELELRFIDAIDFINLCVGAEKDHIENETLLSLL